MKNWICELMPGGSSPLALRARSSSAWLKASPSMSANGRVHPESLLLREDGGPLRHQAEEEEHLLHLRGAASNPEFVILVGELEIDVLRTDGLQRRHGPGRGRRRDNRVLRAVHDQGRE